MTALILIRGGGDLASGVAVRLHRAGLQVVITELPQPLAVRRTVSFAEAVYAGQITIEEVTGRAVGDPAEPARVRELVATGHIPVLADPDCECAAALLPLAIVDARMTKRPPEPLPYMPRLHIGLGPGLNAPGDVHAVIETRRGLTLGRVIWNGTSAPDTTQPEGDRRRVLRAPGDGILEARAGIGDHLETGQAIATIRGVEVRAPFAGTLRGLIHPGVAVAAGMKVGDIDARDDPALCYLVSDKALAVGGGVLEALLTLPDVRRKLWD
jgi:xanthine dehydrogenase accessory factor